MRDEDGLRIRFCASYIFCQFPVRGDQKSQVHDYFLNINDIINLEFASKGQIRESGIGNDGRGLSLTG